MEKTITLNYIVALANGIGEKDIARVAKVKALCRAFNVKYEDYIEILNQYTEWEKSYD